MLADYPVKINDVVLFEANSWEEESTVVENKYETEAGTDQVSVTRYDKLTVSAQYRCHSAWLSQFKRWSKMDTLTVALYDPFTNRYLSRAMRMRNFKSTLIEYSEKVTDTNGVWDVSFSLEEF